MLIPKVLSGLEMVVPVNIISETANMCAYNHHITQETALINSFLAYNIYKFDRYRDSQEVGNSRDKTAEFLIFSSTIFIVTFLIHFKELDTLLIYMSTFMYKNIKRLPVPVKPFYVSSLWAITTNVNDINLLLPYWANIFSLTNLGDITDYEEDISENVTTIPTKFGKKLAFNLCIASSAIALITFTQLPYFENNILNDFFIFSNVVPYMNITL